MNKKLYIPKVYKQKKFNLMYNRLNNNKIKLMIPKFNYKSKMLRINKNYKNNKFYKNSNSKLLRRHSVQSKLINQPLNVISRQL